jgi:hypothetical protein
MPSASHECFPACTLGQAITETGGTDKAMPPPKGFIAQGLLWGRIAVFR